MDVHHPYVPPATHQRPFRDDPVSERRAIQLRRKMVEEQALEDHERETVLDLYDAEIRFTDAEIARLVEGIQDTWKGDPFIAFTADHGESFGEHGRYSHPPTFYDEVLHVPLVIDASDASKTVGTAHEELVGLMDVAPTLVDYADRDQPGNFYGNSLRPLMENGDGTENT